MKHFRAFTFLTAALAVAAIAAGTALAAQSIAFKGSYSGTVTEKVNGQIVTALTKGTGSGTLVGKGSLTGTVTATTAADQPCAPLTGPGTISGPKGKIKLTLVTGSRGCAASEDEKDSITVSGNAKIAGGTLKFKHAKGTLHFSGHYDRKSGAFKVTLTGKLTY